MLILVAPSETELEEKTIWLGNLNSRLSQLGREMTKEFDKHINPQRIFIPSAEHIGELAAILFPFGAPTIVEEFNDRSMGTLTGRTYRETMTEFPRRNWLAWQRSFWKAPPDGESLFDISDRVLTAFRTKVMPIPSQEDVLIICAPDIIRILIGFLTKAEEVEIPKISIEPLIPYVVNGEID